MEINIIRSSRKTLSIQINADLSVTVRAPRRTPKWEIERILKEKDPWIRTHIDKLRRRQEEEAQQEVQYLTNAEIRDLTEKARGIIPHRVAYYAQLVGVSYGNVTIRHQKTRWGSCSSKGNLNFNCLLMMAPPEVMDYVVVHELCHRKEMNHSKRFWSEVDKVFPGYSSCEKWLKTEGRLVMRRLRTKNLEMSYN